MNRAFIFPGQGSQAVGMGKIVAEAFAPARAAFDEVDDALSQNLSRLMFEGPEDELILTANAQPAIMAVSMAVTRVLQAEAGLDMAKHARFVAGHSLGEYSALCAMGALTLADAARLLRIRGASMQEAVPVGEGAMSALIGLDVGVVEEVCDQAKTLGVVVVANDNAPGQVVVSGHKAAVERAIEVAGEKGARRAVLLPVSAPFHCSLMQPAADAMAEALDGISIRQPVVPLVANVTAAQVIDPDTVRAQLVEQVTAMVRWRESVLYMKDQGVETLIEVGAGKVLSGLARRIDRELTGKSLQQPGDFDDIIKEL